MSMKAEEDNLTLCAEYNAFRGEERNPPRTQASERIFLFISRKG